MNAPLRMIRMGLLPLFFVFLMTGMPLYLTAQLSPRIENAFDEYNQELVKVYQVAESESPSVALERIDKMLPQIERKAKALADLVNSDPEAMEWLDSEDSYILFQEKPYFKEIMRIMQNEDFKEKLEIHPELLQKIEEADAIIAAYDKSQSSEDLVGPESATGTAYTMTIEGSDFEGDYEINTDFGENAVAYIDDLGYLRFDILGDSGGEESSVSFFVENTGKGRQDWDTDGHFMYEKLSNDGDLLFSLWGSEGMGYFEITALNNPGDFVEGSIQGTCQLTTDDTDEQVKISAEFRVMYIELEY